MATILVRDGNFANHSIMAGFEIDASVKEPAET
jgi:hypothetical protein